MNTNEKSSGFIAGVVLGLCLVVSVFSFGKETSHNAVSALPVSTTVTNESGGPAAPIVKKVVTESSIVSVGPVIRTDLASVTLAWDAPSDGYSGFNVYHSVIGSSVTNLVATTIGTAAKIDGIPRSITNVFFVTSFITASFESKPSNFILVMIPAKTTIRGDRMAIESAGIFGKTNHIMMATNLLAHSNTNWVKMLTFVGNGQTKVLLHTNSLSYAFFKTITE